MLNRTCFKVIVIFAFLLLCEASLLAPRGMCANSGQTGKTQAMKPILAVAPAEIDLGAIGPAEGAKGTFTIINAGSGKMGWSVDAPEGWTSLDVEKLSLSVTDKPDQLRVHISSLQESDNGEGKNVFPVQLTLEANNQRVSYRKQMASGAHREMLKLVSDGGQKTFFVSFKLVSAESQPVIDVDPARIDFGVVGSAEQVTRRVKVTNRGMSTLKWRAEVQDGAKTVPQAKPGRYVSFCNENVAGTGTFAQPAHLKDSMDVIGKWSEFNGYPSTDPTSNILIYRFYGSGISVFFSGEPDGGELTTYIDNKMAAGPNCHAKQKEQAECLVAEGLSNAAHTLTLMSKAGHVIVEGVKIYGRDVMAGQPGWISIFPDSGTTTRETDFVNIMLDTQKLYPGYYGGQAVFDSNGGPFAVEVFLEVSEENVHKILDVYRYLLGSDYLYTSNPQEDMSVSGYRKQGIAFRLFSPNVPGTTAFYAWVHPRKKVHYYSYDRNGDGKSLKGYHFQGTIGNIATSRLTNTRELYRWFNPITGGYFYTTDPNGEGHLKKGYRFDGIAGYVR